MDTHDPSKLGADPTPQNGVAPNWVHSTAIGPPHDGPLPQNPAVVVAEVVPDQDSEAIPPPWRTYEYDSPAPPVRERRIWLPAGLFLATCFSTLFVGGGQETLESLREHNGLWESIGTGLWYGLQYAVPVMTILICHEMGHFIQAWRYGVYASLPYFIPMPISPIGTFGAVIAMEPRRGDRKAVFDIGISGPLAGLVPTLIFLMVGLAHSTVERVPPGTPTYGDPLIIKILEHFYFGRIPLHYDVMMEPMAFAGWVGLLITSLNLFPVGQLDGGHILYGMLRSKAYPVARFVLIGAWVAVVMFQLWQWCLMLILVTMVLGTRHPPTANDDVPLGVGRYILGFLTLAFIILGFTPWPFSMQ